MGKIERDKGPKGEREWQDFLRQEGFTACRGRQFSRSSDSPEVICDELAEMPVVAHRGNHGDWLVVMRATDWAELVREYIRGCQIERMHDTGHEYSTGGNGGRECAQPQRTQNLAFPLRVR